MTPTTRPRSPAARSTADEQAPRWPRPAVAALAVASGLALAGSLPPWGWWPLAFLGVAGLDRLIADQPGPVRFRRAWLVGMAWIYPAVLFVADMTLIGYLAAGAILGLFPAVAAAITPGDGTRRFVLPGATALTELVRWSWPFGGVPLANLALGQAAAPLGQAARIGGTIGVVALVIVAGQALSSLTERRARPALAGLAVVGLALLVAWSVPRADTVRVADVALVQGGGAQRTRASAEQQPVVLGRHLTASGFIGRPVDLIIWPENVVNPGRLLGYDAARSEVNALAARTGASVLAGWFYAVSDTQTANYQSVITPDGEETDLYDKVILVPFGELVPFRSLIELINDDIPARNVRPGTTDPVLDTPVGPVGVSISWEGFFPRRARAATREGAELLINPSNGASYWLTQVQTQQVASNQLRAIENDRWTLQLAPTGLSAVIDPDGRIQQRTGVGEQAVLVDTVEFRSGETVATRLGPWPMVIYGLAAVGLSWGWRPRRRGDPTGHRPADTAPPGPS
ncbi:MAG: apolipoprotein N-acyltransferase [Acidimicrobiales bacterium]